MKQKTPLVSVVMPVRNAGSFLAEAVTSILNQTYKNIELIVVNDASTDVTSKVLSSFGDKRMKVFTNKKQLGVTKSANFAISKAKGGFIARMDGDDISSPDRIGKQIGFFSRNKKAVAVGGQCELINAHGEVFGSKAFPLTDFGVRKMIFSSVPVQQPTLMVAKLRLPEGFVWYDEDYSSAEELELLFKLFKYGEVRNMRNVLLKYRIHKGNTSLINPKKTFFLTLKTRLVAISRYGYKPSISGVLATIAQTILVSLVPNSWIYPIYSIVRGMYKRNVRIKTDASISLQKAYELDRA